MSARLVMASLVSACICVTHNAVAKDHTRFVVVGYGNVSCGSWTAERTSMSWTANAYSGWVAGYITAFNEWAETGDQRDIMSHTDSKGVEGAVDLYCAHHPIDTLSAAVQDVVGDLLADENQRMIDDVTRQIEKAKRRQ